MPPKILIIGLDGAAPELIENWTGAGHLPNIIALLARGGCTAVCVIFRIQWFVQEDPNSGRGKQCGMVCHNCKSGQVVDGRESTAYEYG